MDYKSSGVDIDAGTKAVNLIKASVATTHNKNVLSGLGNFGAFYSLPKGYKEPILVSCTDGVGTKLKLAIESGIFNTVGIDLVAMSVNDLICGGAKPLFFLDYIACHKLLPEQVKEIIDGIVEGCLQSNCALIGGEMAEMNDLYKKGDFDLAGFAVGIVDKPKIIDGSKIAPGQFVYYLPSSGIHSNGFSLVRKVMDETNLKKFNLTKKDLLTPTKIYVKEVQSILDQGAGISAIAHITGGGLQENIERLLPKNTDVKINKSDIEILNIFNIIQKAGNIADAEMWKVFNMGVGLVIIANNELKIDTTDLRLLGKTEKGHGKVILC
ncbi:phosphoribosylformylglycinamidine cyclo-ligase [Candidatus Margulisiibacteriota bacterium]